MQTYSLESCITTLAEGIAAFQKGAHRLEACTGLDVEGMTPDIQWVADLSKQINMPVRVMIRETEQGFEADEKTLHQMVNDIEAFKSIPIEGFVFGVMQNGRIDRDGMKMLIQAASPLRITFHKAIDQSGDIMEDIEWLNQYPIVDTILTSGGKENAMEGIEQILEIKKRFKGNTMAGGKITPEDLPALHAELQLQWYHGKNIL